MAEQTLTPDLCVIGGGSAGASVAAGAAALGVPVVLIAGSSGNGALGAARSVVAMAAAARQAHEIRRAGELGIDAAEPAIDFGRVRALALTKIADLARNESAARLSALGVPVLEGDPHFIGPATLTVGDREIRARRFVIASASVPAVPEISGLSRTPHLTPDKVLDLRECPRHLIVLGAGTTGLTLAQAIRRLGADVTVLDVATPLAAEDAECAVILLDSLEREGIAVRGGVPIERVEGKRGSVRVRFTANGRIESMEGTHLLIATGRRQEIEVAGLDAAGIEHDAGGIRVTGGLRSKNSRVYVIDETAGLDAARWQARLILNNILFRVPIRVAADRIPRLIATDPELAHVGLRENEAREKHGRIRILRWPLFENDRAGIEQDGKGMIKLVTAAGGRILGATIVGTNAGELIGTYALALSRRMNIRSLAAPIFPYPTRAEIGREAALVGLSRGLTSPWVRRIIAGVRWFG